MINELQLLADSMSNTGIVTASWYREYLEIPNIRPDAPCIHIVLDGKSVAFLERVPEENGPAIRKYGNNQGSFPAMNLTPLFFISKDDKELKEAIQQAIQGKAAVPDLAQVKSWCLADNWDSKFLRKYRISMVERPKKLKNLLQGASAFEPALQLIEAARMFEDPQVLRQALMETCFRMIENRQNVELALRMLFYTEGGNGNLSVVLDTFDLEDEGFPTTGGNFTRGLNKALLLADSEQKSTFEATDTDAFGMPFSPLEEPMPTVKLPAGFTVTIRTMYKGQPCQHRYQRIENGTYPISPEKRNELKAALEWVSAPERKEKTWVSSGKGEVLFVYPSRLHGEVFSYTSLFSRDEEAEKTPAVFEAKAKRFTEHFTKMRKLDPEYYPEDIQLLFLKKLDKARTKVIYSHNSTPQEIIVRCDAWRRASENLPAFHFGQPETPFPLEIAAILNLSWKRDGSLASDKFRAAQITHGLELFFDPEEGKKALDLQLLVRSCENLAVYAGQCFGARGKMMPPKTMRRLKETLALMGMLLDWMGSRKENYMKEYPYLLGQLLKVSDGLHELYCTLVRENVPPQLVGASMYVAAAEFPQRCFAQLGQRMNPYLSWARTHRDVRLPKKSNDPEGTGGPSAGYYLYLYSQIADQLTPAMTEQLRFSDAEKAQLFIGYMASFPRSGKVDNTDNTNHDEGEKENGK